MIRSALVLLLLAGCADQAGRTKAEQRTLGDTGEPQQIPPTPCPVGDLALTRAHMDWDRALLDSWNALRTAPGNCAGVPTDPANALVADEALMWIARCWAFDVSLHGEPAASDQFSDGSTLAQAATRMGYAGTINTWGVVGGVADPGKAFDQWLDSGACEALWTEGTHGATAWSQADPELLVVVRLTGFPL